MRTLLGKITVMVLVYFPLCIENIQQVFSQPLQNDSIHYFLRQFHEKTTDPDFRKATEKVLVLYKADKLNDSLISKLVDIEAMLLDLIHEYSLLNFRPFQYQIVLSFAEKLICVCQEIQPRKENIYYAEALNNLGIFYSHNSQWQKASINSQKAFVIRKKILNKTHPDYAESLITLANILWVTGDRKQAMDFANQALILSKEGKGKFLKIHADCLSFLAGVHKQIFQYDRAIQLWEEELLERKRIFGENNPHYALCVFHMADMYSHLWQFDKSINLLEQAIELTRKTLGDSNLQYAYSLENLGCVYYSMAEYRKAIPYYLKSIAIKEKLYGKDYYDIALSLHNLATTYQQLGDYANALPLFQRGVEISQKATSEGIKVNYGFSLTYLASLYGMMGQNTEALNLLKKGLEVTKKTIDTTINYANSLSHLASLYEKMHNYDSALNCNLQVLKIRHKLLGANDPEFAAGLDNLARLYKKIGKFDIASRLCRQGLSVRSKVLGEESPEYATSLNNLGELFMEMGKYDSAGVLFQHSLKIRKQIFGTVHPNYVKTLTDLGLLNFAQAKNTQAALLLAEANDIELKHIRRTYAALSEKEKLNFINEENTQFSYLPSLLCNNHLLLPAALNQIYTNEMAMKGIVVDNQQQVLSSTRKSNDSSTMKLYWQWRYNKSILGKQHLLPIKERVSFLDSIEHNTNDLEQQLSRNSKLFNNHLQSETVTARNVIQKLEKGQAAIEFLMFRMHDKNKWTDSIIYAASVLLAEDTVAKFISLCSEHQLETTLSQSVDGNPESINKMYSSTKMFGNNADSAVKNLYTLIWKPLEQYLSTIQTIYFAPVGLLNRVAFKALPFDSAHFLIDRYELIQLLSTRTVAFPHPAFTAPASVSIWGNILYDGHDTTPSMDVNEFQKSEVVLTTQQRKGGHWKPLPGTGQEMDSLDNLFRNVGTHIHLASGINATEDNFYALDGNSPQVLHIATHGYYQEKKANTFLKKSTGGNAFKSQDNPMFRSGLILAGGNAAWENEKKSKGKEDGILTAYEIAQLDLSKTKLAVLSACNTALGQVVGKEGVIGLQRAFRMAGVEQMIISLWPIPDKQTTELMVLFYKSWLGGQSTTAALRSAQLHIKEKYPSPYYWAGFVLVE